MEDIFEQFIKTKDFLICVDSDGCAMDTMNVKHKKCFGPEMIGIYDLESHREEILKRWNEINLYTMTRGINRFKALAILLEEIHHKFGLPFNDLKVFLEWTEQSSELSNGALEELIEFNPAESLKKALEWSKSVNKAIQALPEEDHPFDNVKDGLAFLSEFADIAVVSSANQEAIDLEWKKHHLVEYTSVLLSQVAGSKAYCIGRLKEFGYMPEKILMIGDAPGDLEAANKNKIRFYPILVGKESTSWLELKEVAAKKFLVGTYNQQFQDMLLQSFLQNLQS